MVDPRGVALVALLALGLVSSVLRLNRSPDKSKSERAIRVVVAIASLAGFIVFVTLTIKNRWH